MGHYGQDLAQRLIALKLVRRYELVGCTRDEINELMKAQNVSFLPKVYWEYLEIMGRNDSGFSAGSYRTYPFLKEAKQIAEDVMSGYNEYCGLNLRLPSDAFVFNNTDGFAFFYFRTGTRNDNPPVRSFLDENSIAWSLSTSFTTWFDNRIKEWLRNTGRYKDLAAL